MMYSVWVHVCVGVCVCVCVCVEGHVQYVSCLCCMGCDKVLSYSEAWLRQPPVDQFELTCIERWMLSEVDCNVLVLFVAREADRFREGAA